MIEYKSFTDFPRRTMYAILKDAYSYDDRNNIGAIYEEENFPFCKWLEW